MRVVGFGTYDLGRHPRVGIILDGLRARGEEVIELNEPLGFSTAERVAMLAKPWLAYRLLVRLLVTWRALARRTAQVRREAPIDLVIVGYLGHFDVLLARVLFGRRTRIALDLMIFAADTARDRGHDGGTKLWLLDELDRAAVAAADLVLLDTEEQVALLAPRSRAKAVVVPVGAAPEWFAAGAGRVAEPAAGLPLRVVFYGLYTPLQGATTIGSALGLLAGRTDIAVTMIGSGQDHATTRAAARGTAGVTWIDWIDPAELPGVVATHDVCLGIFGTTDKAHRVVPNKVYQGAAAGCAVVTSDTAPQRRALGEAALYVAPGDASALAATLIALAEDPEAVRLFARSAVTVAERFAPPAIVQPLRDRLSSVD